MADEVPDAIPQGLVDEAQRVFPIENGTQNWHRVYNRMRMTVPGLTMEQYRALLLAVAEEWRNAGGQPTPPGGEDTPEGAAAGRRLREQSIRHIASRLGFLTLAHEPGEARTQLDASDGQEQQAIDAVQGLVHSILRNVNDSLRHTIPEAVVEALNARLPGALEEALKGLVQRLAALEGQVNDLLRTNAELKGKVVALERNSVPFNVLLNAFEAVARRLDAAGVPPAE